MFVFLLCITQSEKKVFQKKTVIPYLSLPTQNFYFTLVSTFKELYKS